MYLRKNVLRTITVGLFLVLFITGIYSAARQKFTVFSNHCVGCMDCIKVCPKDAIHIVRGKAVIDAEKCIGCKICYYICSFGAIK